MQTFPVTVFFLFYPVKGDRLIGRGGNKKGRWLWCIVCQCELVLTFSLSLSLRREWGGASVLIISSFFGKRSRKRSKKEVLKFWRKLEIRSRVLPRHRCGSKQLKPKKQREKQRSNQANSRVPDLFSFFPFPPLPPFPYSLPMGLLLPPSFH